MTVEYLCPGSGERVRLLRWLRDRADLLGELTVEPVPGGYSNLTFLLGDEFGSKWVLRRPPHGEHAATAHDVEREYRFMAALGTSEIPVPTVVGFCSDPGVIGAPFFVTEYVDGVVLHTTADAERSFGPSIRTRCGVRFIEAQVAIHSLDFDAAGLGEFHRPGGYVSRQIRRWSKQYEAVASRELDLYPAVLAALLARLPADERPALVHGDFHLDNAIFKPSGDVAAVLDWELAAIGDPLADFGMAVAYWRQPADAAGLPSMPTAVSGFPTRQEIIRLYGERSGLDLSNLSFYVAFAHWKIACIAESVYMRFSSGAMGSHVHDLDFLAAHPPARLRAAASALEGEL